MRAHLKFYQNAYKISVIEFIVTQLEFRLHSFESALLKSTTEVSGGVSFL